MTDDYIHTSIMLNGKPLHTHTPSTHKMEHLRSSQGQEFGLRKPSWHEVCSEYSTAALERRQWPAMASIV